MYDVTETDGYGVHEMVDVSKLTDKEMNLELAARVHRMIDSEGNLSTFLNIYGTNEDDYSDDIANKYNDLVTEHDEDFCLVRECLRQITGDKNFLEC